MTFLSPQKMIEKRKKDTLLKRESLKPIKEVLVPLIQERLDKAFDIENPDKTITIKIKETENETIKDILAKDQKETLSLLAIDLREDFAKATWEAKITKTKTRWDSYFTLVLKPRPTSKSLSRDKDQE